MYKRFCWTPKKLFFRLLVHYYTLINLPALIHFPPELLFSHKESRNKIDWESNTHLKFKSCNLQDSEMKKVFKL